MGWDEAFGGAVSTDVVDDPIEVAARRIEERSTKRFVRKRRSTHRKSDKRRDIQGMRAVAVGAVVVNHLTRHPQGGFVGVDVFFVISGYLITSLLLREEARSGTISMLGFYKRRIRRLFPAALTVIVLTVIVSHFLFLNERAKSTMIDGFFAAFFGANWRQIYLGTDYFRSYGPVSPLQHYWSLSVEEQFYFVWPLVLLIAFVVCRRLLHGRAHAVVATGTIGAMLLTVPSLVYAWHESSVNKVINYFSTFSRAWELGLGATLAVLTPWMRGSKLLLTVMSWTGLTLIGISLFTVSEAHVPFPGAILPCVGSGLCLFAWTQNTAARNILLTNRVANYLGDISYSIYLVHFPVIIFAASLTTDRSFLYYLSVSIFILGASATLYHGIENPIRESNWLLPKSSQRRSRSLRETGAGRPLLLSATTALIAVAMYMAFAVPATTTNPYASLVLQDVPSGTTSSSPGVVSFDSQHNNGVAIGPALAGVQADLRQAALATSWPNISPPWDQPAPEYNNGCQQPGLPLPPISQCTWGNKAAHHTLVLVGDSTSGAYTNTFDHFIDKVPDWKMVVRNTTACPFSDSGYIESNAAAHSADCANRNAAILKELQATKPDMVIMTTTRGDADRVGSLSNQLAKLKGFVQTIVVFPAPPKIADPLQCVTAASKPPDCLTKLPGLFTTWMTNEKAMAEKLGAKFIDPTLLYCVDNLCPLFVKNIPLSKDGSHLTPTYATYLAPATYELYKALKLLP